MNIAGINYESINDGEGVRTVIYVSGCSHKCLNCHNPETHDVNYGIEFTNELQNEILTSIEKRPFISGVTLSGGDPLNDNNLLDIYHFVNKLKDKFPEKNIWLYTGYTWEEIMWPNNCRLTMTHLLRATIVRLCDVVVDGPYIEEQRDITLKFRGSKNQRLIDVKETSKQGKIITIQN